MNDYELRATVLLEQGIIQQDTYETTWKILAYLQESYEFHGEEETALVIHLLMCLERTYHGVVLTDDPKHIKEELVKTEGYQTMVDELEHLQTIANVSLTESEKTYVLIHLLRLYPKRKKEKENGAN